MSETSKKSYKKAVGSLQFFVNGAHGDLEIEKIPGEWVVAMFAGGLSPKSRLHYFEAVAALFSSAAKAGIIEPVEAFGRLKPRVKEMASTATAEVSATDVDRLRTLARSFFAARSTYDPIKGLVLMSLVNGARPPLTFATLRVGDYEDLNPEGREIADCLMAPGRKYVFALDQSRLTPRQLERHVASTVGSTLAAAQVALPGGVRETLGACWALGALSCGANGASTLATLGFVPAAVPVLKLVAPEASAEIRSNLRQMVGSMFMANPKEWFAMRLRPHVKYDRLRARLDNLADSERPEVFYPCKEISRRVNKKIVSEQKPVLPEILFFRSRITEISAVMAEVGDLGWVYAEAGTYARIPARAMEAFQRAIGQFMPGYEVGGIGTLEYHPGDRVEIIGGLGHGYKGEIIESIDAREGVIYRLRIFGDQRDIEFRIADSRILRPSKLKDNN